MPDTLFISDLHLSEERPAINRLFLEFLQHEACHAAALYILGDLFEYWLGDDACRQGEFAGIVQALRALTDSGVPLYIMHGNRDFLLGPAFQQATGAQLMDDPGLIHLDDIPVLLMHGDTLCTDDHEYQAVRKMVRSPKWQQDFLSRPLAERTALSRQYREQSKAVTAAKQADIMDVNEDAVRAAFREHHSTLLVHGHTHRPGRHTYRFDGHEHTRIVLGDWYTQGSVLRYHKGQWLLEQLAPAA